jgi:hypothetical protein
VYKITRRQIGLEDFLKLKKYGIFKKMRIDAKPI